MLAVAAKGVPEDREMWGASSEASTSGVLESTIAVSGAGWSSPDAVIGSPRQNKPRSTSKATVDDPRNSLGYETFSHDVTSSKSSVIDVDTYPIREEGRSSESTPRKEVVAEECRGPGAPAESVASEPAGSDSSSCQSDVPLPHSLMGQCQYWANKLVSSPNFDAMIGAVIVANSVTVGIEQTYRIQGKSTAIVDLLEHLFLATYLLELGLRFCARGCSCLRDNWVKFDVLLVAVGVAESWVLSPYLGPTDDLGPVMVLRTLRLLRLARALRLLIVFRELWMLVQGLLNSGRTMIYTFILLFSMVYIFSCVSIELIAQHHLAVGPEPDEEFQRIVESNFSSVPEAMMTLLQFVCFDNIVYIYRPLIKADARLAVFFASIIIIVGIACMNLITAVIVNSALEQAAQDKDVLRVHEQAKYRKLVKDVRQIFVRLDRDNSGEVTREEMENVDDGDRAVLSQLSAVHDLSMMFDALDVDHNGGLDIDEFVDGIWRVSISNTPLEIKRIEKQCNYLHKQARRATEWQDRMEKALSLVLEELRGGAGSAGAGAVDGDAVPTSGPCTPRGPAKPAPEMPPHVDPCASTMTGHVSMTSSLPPPIWAEELVEKLRRDVDDVARAFLCMAEDLRTSRNQSSRAQSFAVGRAKSKGALPAKMRTSTMSSLSDPGPPPSTSPFRSATPNIRSSPSPSKASASACRVATPSSQGSRPLSKVSASLYQMAMPSNRSSRTLSRASASLHQLAGRAKSPENSTRRPHHTEHGDPSLFRNTQKV